MTTDTALCEAWEKWHTPREFQNVQSGLDDMLSFEAGWQLCAAHLAQQPVAEIDECAIEDMSTLLCSADGKDPFRMCYHTVEPGVMEPYGEQWVYYREMAIAVLKRQPQPDTARDDRQRTVSDWCRNAFGDHQASSLPQRGIRLLEEAIEAAQAAGCERDMSHKLVDFIFDRPAGELKQELGGIGVTLLALAAAANLSADDCETREIERVLSKPLTHFAQRNQAKNDAGFEASQNKDPQP